jgi:hypothetical protein
MSVTVLPRAVLILDSKIGFTGQVPLPASFAVAMFRPAMLPDSLKDQALEPVCGAILPRCGSC